MKTIPAEEFYIIDYGDGTFYRETSVQTGQGFAIRADSTKHITMAHRFETFGDADEALQDYLTSPLQFQSSIKKITVVYNVSN